MWNIPVEVWLSTLARVFHGGDFFSQFPRVSSLKKSRMIVLFSWAQIAMFANHQLLLSIQDIFQSSTEPSDERFLHGNLRLPAV